MKIKKVCEETGLTDRTVRYYIEEKLISPSYTENYLGRKSFDFSEEDLKRLKDIATLRAFGFSVEEIKALASGQESSRQIVESVKKRTENTIDENQRRMNVFSALDPTEDTDLSMLADKLAMFDLKAKNETAGGIQKKSLLCILRSCGMFLAVWSPIVLPIIVLIFKFFMVDAPLVRPLFLTFALLCFLPSLVTLLAFRRLGGAKKLLRILLISLCLVCLPSGIFFSSKSVTLCQHKYETYKTLTEATCHSEGEEIAKCDDCGVLQTRKVEKLSHIPTVLDGVAPTCLQSGLSEGSICSLCGTVLTEQIALPKAETHTSVTVDEAVAATCKSAGRTEGSHCSTCKAVIVKQKSIPKKAHTYQTKTVQATCGSDGYVLHKCKDCSESYKSNIVHATNEHNFKSTDRWDYICVKCGLNVIEHGNYDGSRSGGNNNIKYYITGGISEHPIERTLVIYTSNFCSGFQNPGRAAGDGQDIALNHRDLCFVLVIDD